MTAYKIADEPSPSDLSQYAVNPIFPLLGGMFGGVWLAWTWFFFNGKAVGSPTLSKELKWLGLGLLGIAGLVFVFIPLLISAEVVPPGGVKYVFLLVTAVKLAVLYAVFSLQSRTIEIYAHYGGTLRNGLWVLIGLTWLGFKLYPLVPPILRRVLF